MKRIYNDMYKSGESDTGMMDVSSITTSTTTTTTPMHLNIDASCFATMTTRDLRHRWWIESHRVNKSLLFHITMIVSLLLVGSTTKCCCYAGTSSNTTIQQQQQRRLSNKNDPTKTKKNRILYIITALAEYNSGTRNTVRGSDRLQETLIPVVSEGVNSMIQAGYTVDVFLVAHFILRPERVALITNALPKNVGFDYWNEATPLGYDTGSKKLDRKLENRTLHLARQHRFVIKDKLLQYDMFVVFEDDMLITADHINHYVAVTNELRRLEELAPADLPSSISKEDAIQQYHGTMTKGQLRRMIPGFMRVEVLLDEKNYPAQSKTGPVPVDLSFTNKNGKKQKSESKTVNAKSCCHISDHLSNENRPIQPAADKLMIWETNILPLGIRKMPSESWLDWVVLQRGPNQNDLNINETIGDYWSNRNYDFYGKREKRPAPQEFKYINNMGGWMATREQLYVYLLFMPLFLVSNITFYCYDKLKRPTIFSLTRSATVLFLATL